MDLNELVSLASPLFKKYKLTDEEIDSIIMGSDEDLDNFLMGSVPKVIIDEKQHPDLDFLGKDGRMSIKMFGDENTYADAVKKKLGKDYEVINQDKRVLIKKKGERRYKVLDPDQGYLPDSLNPTKIKEWAVETGKDIAESGFDIGSGSIETAISGLAASGVLKRALAKGAIPKGVVAKSAAATGATGGLADVLRQYIGTKAGVRDKIDYGQAAMRGGTGAMFNFLLGAGIPKDKVREIVMGVKPEDAVKILQRSPDRMKEFFVPERAHRELLEQALNKNRGAVEKTYRAITRKIGPAALSLMSGTPKKFLNRMVQRWDKMVKIADDPFNKPADFARRILKKSEERKQTISKQLDKVRSQYSEAPVQIKQAKDLFENRINELEAKMSDRKGPGLQTDETDLLNTLREAYGRFVTNTKKEMKKEVTRTAGILPTTKTTFKEVLTNQPLGDVTSLKYLKSIQETARNLANFRRETNEKALRSTAAEKEAQRLFKKVYHTLNEAEENAIKSTNIPDAMTDARYLKELRKEYSDRAKVDAYLKQSFSENPDTGYIGFTDKAYQLLMDDADVDSNFFRYQIARMDSYDGKKIGDAFIDEMDDLAAFSQAGPQAKKMRSSAMQGDIGAAMPTPEGSIPYATKRIIGRLAIMDPYTASKILKSSKDIVESPAGSLMRVLPGSAGKVAGRMYAEEKNKPYEESEKDYFSNLYQEKKASGMKELQSIWDKIKP